jgi:hypothetical protein
VGTVATNFYPVTSGLSLGSQAQRWLLNGQAPLTVGPPVAVPFSATPAFTATIGGLVVFSMTITGNVTASALTLPTAALVIFQLTQDATGNRTFAWPPNLFGGGTVQGPAGQVYTQHFYFDGTNAWALGPGGTV